MLPYSSQLLSQGDYWVSGSEETAVHGFRHWYVTAIWIQCTIY